MTETLSKIAEAFGVELPWSKGRYPSAVSSSSLVRPQMAAAVGG
jgi:hypothetical protein